MVDLPSHCRIGNYEKLMEYGFTVNTNTHLHTVKYGAASGDSLLSNTVAENMPPLHRELSWTTTRLFSAPRRKPQHEIRLYVGFTYDKR